MSTDNPANSDDSATTSNFRVTTAAMTALVMALLAIVLMLGLAYFAFAQRIPELTPEAFEDALAKWEQNGPASYTMDIKLSGTRPEDVHIEVTNGVPVAMTRGGNTPDQERVWSVWTVPGMFETIERELELADDPEREMQAAEGTKLWLRCKFDPTYGYPAIFHRAIRGGGGPEVYWEVTRFETKENPQD